MKRLRGLVLSDLHLFSQRSCGEARLASLRCRMQGIDALVLNGDIFDFRWSEIRPEEKAIRKAVERIHSLSNECEGVTIHYISGNHDCHPNFLRQLGGVKNLFLHSHHLRLGNNLFLHGDATNRRMTTASFAKHRAKWERDRTRNSTLASCYSASDRLKISHLFHRLYFPGDSALRRLAWHLDRSVPEWRTYTKHCFFGHTHRAFQSRLYEGILFHNTGSALQGMGFQPLPFVFEESQNHIYNERE